MAQGSTVAALNHAENGWAPAERQYISELAARGTPTQHSMQAAGFILPGLMIVAFGVLVGLSARTKL